MPNLSMALCQSQAALRLEPRSLTPCSSLSLPAPSTTSLPEKEERGAQHPSQEWPGGANVLQQTQELVLWLVSWWFGPLFLHCFCDVYCTALSPLPSAVSAEESEKSSLSVIMWEAVHCVMGKSTDPKPDRTWLKLGIYTYWYASCFTGW